MNIVRYDCLKSLTNVPASTYKTLTDDAILRRVREFKHWDPCTYDTTMAALTGTGLSALLHDAFMTRDDTGKDLAIFERVILF